VDNNGELWAGSDRAPTAGTDFVQYYAPGVNVQFIDRDGAKVKGSGTSYGIFPCLSFSPQEATNKRHVSAAIHVTAMFAYLRSADPKYDSMEPEVVIDTLKSDLRTYSWPRKEGGKNVIYNNIQTSGPLQCGPGNTNLEKRQGSISLVESCSLSISSRSGASASLSTMISSGNSVAGSHMKTSLSISQSVYSRTFSTFASSGFSSQIGPGITLARSTSNTVQSNSTIAGSTSAGVPASAPETIRSGSNSASTMAASRTDSNSVSALATSTSSPRLAKTMTGTPASTAQNLPTSSLVPTTTVSSESLSTTGSIITSNSVLNSVDWPVSSSNVVCGQGSYSGVPTPAAMNLQGASTAVSSFCSSLAAQTATLNLDHSQWGDGLEPPSDEGVSILSVIRFNYQKPDCAPFFFAGDGQAHCLSNLLAPINSCDGGSSNGKYGGYWMDDCSSWQIVGIPETNSSGTTTTTAPSPTTPPSTLPPTTSATTDPAKPTPSCGEGQNVKLSPFNLNSGISEFCATQTSSLPATSLLTATYLNPIPTGGDINKNTFFELTVRWEGTDTKDQCPGFAPSDNNGSRCTEAFDLIYLWRKFIGLLACSCPGSEGSFRLCTNADVRFLLGDGDVYSGGSLNATLDCAYWTIEPFKIGDRPPPK